jgi:tripartite-type tricarboxylate transporter receptor subunit TctC
MTMRVELAVAAAVLGGCCALSAADVNAQSGDAAAFYQGKQVTVVVGYPPGGGYDVYARLLVRHMGRNIPGQPSMVPNNMPGAGSMIAANYLYNRAPKDGTVFGMFAGGMALAPLLGDTKALFDSRKLSWLGSMNEETSLCLAWATSGFKTIEDVLTREFTIGTASSTGTSYAFPTSSNSLLGTKFKLVSGYPGSSGVMLAVERGEVEGMCGMPLATLQTVRPQWLEKKQINILVQEATRRHPDLPDVPTVLDLAKTDDTKRVVELIYGWQIMGRPFTAPPDVPAVRLAALRAAFDATMKDPVFVAEAEKQHVDISPIGAKEIEEFIARAYETPKHLVTRAMEAQGRTGAE